jgi:hypothetical protein
VDAAGVLADGAEDTFFHVLRGTKHRLLLFAGPSDERTSRELARIARQVCDAHGDWIDVSVIVKRRAALEVPAGATCVEDPRGALHGRYGADAACSYLIRPDGYVAHRCRRLDGLEAYLARVL